MWHYLHYVPIKFALCIYLFPININSMHKILSFLFYKETEAPDLNFNGYPV
jgi:hypothetical protein